MFRRRHFITRVKPYWIRHPFQMLFNRRKAIAARDAEFIIVINKNRNHS